MKDTQPSDMTVVGIGASTGALDALLQLLKHIPEHTGLTYVVVVHLLASDESHLHEILKHGSNIPVQQVEGDTPLEPDHVYVIPPNSNLNSIDRQLRLSTLKQAGRSPIDHFFRSLANTHDGHSVGIVLTGTGADGTLGLREIRRQGGLTIVQDPGEAEQESMPLSAISGGQVDAVLPLDKIPGFFLNYTQCEPDVDPMIKENTIKSETKSEVRRIFDLVKTRTGHDMKDFRMQKVLRSIRRRMKLHQIQKLTDYTEKILLSPEEADALCRELMLIMSHFFRLDELMHKLEDELIPQLIADKVNQEPLRIWVVGCSTGEDAYSLAMLIREVLDRYEDHFNVQIFASDLYDSSLQKARAGFYAGNLYQDIGEQRLNRFFVKDGNGYRVRAFLRDMMVFTRHNLLHDPPFSHVDLIYSGSLLQTLNPKVRQEVLSLFHFALSPGRYLVYDKSNVNIDTDHFIPLSEGVPILQKKNDTKAKAQTSTFPRMIFNPPATESKEKLMPLKPAQLHEQMLLREVSSLLLNYEQEVLHVAGNAGRYLSFPAGEFKPQLMSLLLPALRLPVKAALCKIMENTEAETTPPVCLYLDNTSHTVIVKIKNVVGEDEKPMILLFFEEVAAAPKSHGGASIAENDIGGQSQENKYLHTVLEEYEKNQMQLEAANKELSSALEEVHTSQEELLSANVELRSLNQENKMHVDELQTLSDDLEKLLSSTELAIIFLDNQLQIVRFTPKTQELFNLRLEDMGRKITDQTHHLHYPELEEDLEKVYQTLIPIEREVFDDQKRWYMVRVLPYRSGPSKIMGVVLSLIDITVRRENEQMEREMQTAAETARAKDEFLSTISHEIRTPLNAIVGLSDILSRHKPRKDQVKNLESLQFAAQGLLRLVNDILDFSKLQAGKMELESMSYQPVQLLERLKNTYEPTAREKNIKLRLEKDPDLPPFLVGDPHKLTQILHNLLSNAIKFTEKGHVMLKFSQESRENGKVNLLVCVRDTGIGISEQQQEHIFEKFSQADPTTMRRYGGTGLGLAISQSLLQLMGSEIHLESKEGEGTRFFFCLQQDIGEQAVDEPEDAIELVGDEHDKMRQARILLADDVEVNRLLLQRYLEEWSQVTADEAINGREALEMASKQPYDIILMDIRMPEMDGKEATRRIRKLNPHYQKIPIIALTADLSVMDEDESGIRLFDQTVTKPFEPQSLKNTIFGLIQRGEAKTKTVNHNQSGTRDQQILNKHEPNFELAEKPFEGMPERKRRFYNMSIRAMQAFRETLQRNFPAKNFYEIEAVMHKQKPLFQMLNLGDFYGEIQQARQNLKNDQSDKLSTMLPPEVNEGLDTVILRLKERLDSLPAAKKDD